ncbi:hypothetical protein GCM10023352_11740 [Rothia endophytica]|uniref:Uncharacterized protein n=1 Tax=Rothia endophytica TaxID=1324766 RepID=A0ABP9BIF6_9MICC
MAAGLPGRRDYVATRGQIPPEMLVVHTYYWEFSGPYLGRSGADVRHNRPLTHLNPGRGLAPEEVEH